MTRLRASAYAAGCVASLAVALLTAMAAVDSLPAPMFGRALMLGMAVLFLATSWALAMEAATRWPHKPP